MDMAGALQSSQVVGCLGIPATRHHVPSVGCVLVGELKPETRLAPVRTDVTRLRYLVSRTAGHICMLLISVTGNAGW